MALNTQTELPPDETAAILRRHETGVISLARDDDPYAIPISYGYDPDERTFYLRLVSSPESEKRRFLASTPTARLVVYEEETDTYRSVVAQGPLEEVERDDLSVEHIEQYGEAKRPLFEIWGEEKRDLDIHLYRLVAETLSGREITVER
ncbi:nitroimidazol reductase NimA-like FMN-containing flavoprotein (pyridoxamine 5'-phosphate oxidase superfamily) [Halarchaeum rubridurum]|uniref:Pyridoxamine 5'-phosphate oxidase n=1 Tax=Halarchaeum rubridurum TaxID=489911 RepID=A0A830FUK0_9EURY|nr:pyridoxamine 5'-phosphate oxidase family protein [Halarchaeum rubridurum]MBP1954738.1 nitroimidazol reductase NimA-like FMN-containing flavoprotein (pyridoxamine 5'-phosphate oxidase superfamily) [Halarchaeum rubridurum]GGM63484.1 pyridoxamine 5'-phosphate oxidase [Halarchaeum rubridurum]